MFEFHSQSWTCAPLFRGCAHVIHAEDRGASRFGIAYDSSAGRYERISPFASWACSLEFRNRRRIAFWLRSSRESPRCSTQRLSTDASPGSLTARSCRHAITRRRRNRRTTAGHAISKCWCAAEIFAFLRSAVAALGTATTPFTTAVRSSSGCVGNTVASSQTAAIAESPSFGRRSFGRTASCGTVRGADIAGVARALNTHSPD